MGINLRFVICKYNNFKKKMLSMTKMSTIDTYHR